MLLRTDAARSDIGDAAVLETQSRICDVFAAAQNRHADGIDRLNRRTDEMQNDLEIVDHQIEHDADVGAAIRVRRKPMRLDETRMSQTLFECAEHRIETLHVTNLQDEIFAARRVQPVRSRARYFRQSAFR